MTGQRGLPDHVKEQIALLPGGDGWWKSGGQDTYEKLAVDLVAHGYTEDEAVDLLAEAYGAVAEEYGD